VRESLSLRWYYRGSLWRKSVCISECVHCVLQFELLRVLQCVLQCGEKVCVGECVHCVLRCVLRIRGCVQCVLRCALRCVL